MHVTISVGGDTGMNPCTRMSMYAFMYDNILVGAQELIYVYEHV